MGIPGTTIRVPPLRPFIHFRNCGDVTSQPVDARPLPLSFPFLSPCTKMELGSRNGGNGSVGVNFMVFGPFEELKPGPML